MLAVIATIIVIISLLLYVANPLIEGNNKRRIIIKKYLTVGVYISLIASVTIMMYQGYERVILPNITAYNIEHGIPDNIEEGPLTVISEKIVPTARAAETPEINAPTIKVTEDIVFVDSSNNSHTASDLIGKSICTYYTGDNGEVCIFIGQYDNNYSWNGNCSICAYKDGHLYYSTEDVYEHGNIVSYRRCSKSTSSERWLITEKSVLDNNLTIGDTRSYPYYDINSKINDIDIYNKTISYTPKMSDIYTIKELYDQLSPTLNKHYYGMYDSYGNWEDTTGNAYSIEYENGTISTIIKGVFDDNSFMSGHEYDIKEDGTVIHTYGKFRERPNGDILGEDYTVSETLTMEQFKIRLSEERYENEVLSSINI